MIQILFPVVFPNKKGDFFHCSRKGNPMRFLLECANIYCFPGSISPNTEKTNMDDYVYPRKTEKYGNKNQNP